MCWVHRVQFGSIVIISDIWVRRFINIDQWSLGSNYYDNLCFVCWIDFFVCVFHWEYKYSIDNQFMVCYISKILAWNRNFPQFSGIKVDNFIVLSDENKVGWQIAHSKRLHFLFVFFFHRYFSLTLNSPKRDIVNSFYPFSICVFKWMRDA